MARFLNLARTLPLPLLKTLTLTPNRRPYIANMRLSAFRDKLLRLLRSEIASADHPSPPPPPPPPPPPFSIDGCPGEKRVRLTRDHRSETVQIDATTIDGAAPSTRSNHEDSSARFHISVTVDVLKGDDASNSVLRFLCSAWPDALDVEKVFTVRKAAEAVEPFMGPDFGELDEELQGAVRGYLEERGVNDELAEFLHGYMEGKDRGELVRWLKNVESYVRK